MSGTKILKTLAYSVTVILLVHFVNAYWSDLSTLNFNLSDLALGIFFGIAVLILRAAAFHFIFTELNKTTSSVSDSLFVTAKATLFNQIYPTRVGSLLLINEIKKKGNLSYPNATAMYGGSAVLSLLLTLVIATIGGILGNGLPQMMLIVVPVLVAAAITFLFIGRKILRGRILELWHELTFFLSRPCGKPFIAISAIELLVMSLTMKLFYMALGVEVSFTDSMVMMGIRNLSLLLALTPGAMGLSEVTIGHMSNLLQHGGAAGISAALLLRFTLLGSSGLLWLVESGAKVWRG